MNEQQARGAICEVGRRLYARNLVAATDGNISIRIGGDRYVCTPSGISKGCMRPEDLMIADGRGERVSGTGKVTSEFFTHLAAYEERPNIAAVVHAHPPFATALTIAGLGMTDPVNVPGTSVQHANWQRKLSEDLSVTLQKEEVQELQR